MIVLDPAPSEASAFVDQVSAAIRGILAMHRPKACYIVQIRDFFDSKWLGFSGKVLGALGVHGTLLTVPPFHPHRVLRQRHLIHQDFDSQYRADDDVMPLHIRQPSSRNLTRRAGTVAPGAAFAWYSSGSMVSGRASLMAYVPVAGAYWHWYIAMRQGDPWRISRSKGISKGEFGSLCAYGS